MNIKKAIATETKIAWGITKEKGFTYDPEGFWLALEKRMNDIPLTDDELTNYMRGFIVCTIIEINIKWPHRENEGKNAFQKSILSIVVADLMDFYEKDPQKYFFNYLPKKPTSDNEKRHLHRHIKGKARLQILTALEVVQTEERDPALKPRKVKKKKVDGLWVDTSEDEYTTPESFSLDASLEYEDGEGKYELPDERYIGELELSEMDEVVLATQGAASNSTYNQAQLKNEVADFFNNFYLENRNQVDRIADFFKNISFYRFPTKNIWSAKMVSFNSIEIWDYLKILDKKMALSDHAKERLFLFYLIVCVAAMKQKAEDSVINADGFSSHRVVISRPLADILYNLIVKTFLYFTFDLHQKVFSRVIDPPPETKSDVGKFQSAIKDKPREMLKKKTLPKNAFMTPEQAEKAKEEAKRQREKKSVSSKSSIRSDESIFDFHLDLTELFESYEVFEYLSNKVLEAFKTGKLDDTTIDMADVTKLKDFLIEEKIILSTIFNFLNPESQKEKDNKDFSYLTQGTVSAITTGIMSRFKKDDGKLQIILTKEEDSLDTTILSKLSADFIMTMIEKDFDITRGDVSSSASSLIEKSIPEIDDPFKVSIPTGSEYDSFRMMVDMNGPIKVAIPFTTQGEDPFWSNKEVLNDKMVQMVDVSIKDTINQANISKAILKHL